MTDLEMTNLCAEAMGLTISDVPHAVYVYDYEGNDLYYDPLHDDAQAMALVKKLRIGVDYCTSGEWQAWNEHFDVATLNNDLNRAIVECVAKMQKVDHD